VRDTLAAAVRPRLMAPDQEWIMSNTEQSNPRRRFLRLVATSAAVAPLAAVVLPRFALAADLPPLDPNDPTAKALQYTEDAKTAASNPAYKPGSECANCQFYLGKPGDARGGCQLFAGKSVNAKGWCASWTKKA
jgi:high potential iron-sulfur protein